MRMQSIRCIASEHAHTRERYLCEICLAALVLGGNPVFRPINELIYLISNLGWELGRLRQAALEWLIYYLFRSRSKFNVLVRSRPSQTGCKCKCRCHYKCRCACRCKRGELGTTSFNYPHGSKPLPFIAKLSNIVPEIQAWIDVVFRVLGYALQLLWLFVSGIFLLFQCLFPGACQSQSQEDHERHKARKQLEYEQDQLEQREWENEQQRNFEMRQRLNQKLEDEEQKSFERERNDYDRQRDYENRDRDMIKVHSILTEYVKLPISTGREAEDDQQRKQLIGLIKAVPDKTVDSSDVLWYANKALEDRSRRDKEHPPFTKEPPRHDKHAITAEHTLSKSDLMSPPDRSIFKNMNK